VRASVLVLLLAAAVNAGSEEALPIGLLDFLSIMVEADGELIDPLSLETPADDALSRSESARSAAEIEDVARKDVSDEGSSQGSTRQEDEHD